MVGSTGVPAEIMCLNFAFLMSKFQPATWYIPQGPGWNAMIEGAHTVSNGLRITVYSHDSNSVNWEVW